LFIVSADYIVTCDEECSVLEDLSICFDEKILKIDKLENLKTKYPEAKVLQKEENIALLPGLINAHVHLEFSANKTTLVYGDFIEWLMSVINFRDELSQKCEVGCIDEAILSMAKSGTTTFGAISSHGLDLQSCVKTPLNVVFFNEVLGSNPAAVDALYQDFLGRLYESMEYKNGNFTPAVSVHSPYSTHPILAKKVLSLVKEKNLLISTHFMESLAEREWLDNSDGDFLKFFEKFIPNSKPMVGSLEYLKLFEESKTLFTHATHATKNELELMQNIGVITHCPVSNRLLGNGKLQIKDLKEFTLATDGLSSNNSLNLWDEMRSALSMHYDIPLQTLSKILLLASTKNGAKALNKNAGEIKEGMDADFILVKMADSVKKEELITQLILHTKEVDEVFVAGKSLDV
jgi:cytosine/adenosine deaminase-related metal-dependent hydrolase